MKIPADLKYTEADEWVRVEGDEVVIGITDYAQDALSDIVYVELPDEEESFKAGSAFGVVESVKAASDLYMPVDGTIVEVNEDLMDAPEVVNEDPYGKAWMIRVALSDKSQLEDLMDADAYEAYCAERD